MGHVSGEWSEGRVVVLTVELRGTGVVQRVGDMAANPSSGLPRGPSGSGRCLAIIALVGNRGREGCQCLLVSWEGQASSEPLVMWWPIHRPGFRGSPPSGSRRCVAVLCHHSVEYCRCRSAVGVVGCCSGWLVVVVRKLVMPHHAVWLCKDVTRGTKQNQVTSRDLTCNVQLY